MTPKEITNGFKSITALVVGDVMLDAYLWGRVDRISPEAPVPVVQVGRPTQVPAPAAVFAPAPARISRLPITESGRASVAPYGVKISTFSPTSRRNAS